MRFPILFILTILSLNVAMAQSPGAISAIGKHYPIFTIEKSENSENIMIAYTKLDSHCHIAADPAADNDPTFDFYWLMNRQTYKPVHPLIKNGIRGRLKVGLADTQDNFFAQMNDLKEVQSDIKDPRLVIISTTTPLGKCEVHSFLTLGPSNQNITIRLDTIYSESQKTFIPPFRKVKSITLNGINVATRQKVSRKYLAK